MGGWIEGRQRRLVGEMRRTFCASFRSRIKSRLSCLPQIIVDKQPTDKKTTTLLVLVVMKTIDLASVALLGRRETANLSWSKAWQMRGRYSSCTPFPALTDELLGGLVSFVVHVLHHVHQS